jgi:hypothetical protein
MSQHILPLSYQTLFNINIFNTDIVDTIYGFIYLGWFSQCILFFSGISYCCCYYRDAARSLYISFVLSRKMWFLRSRAQTVRDREKVFRGYRMRYTSHVHCMPAPLSEAGVKPRTWRSPTVNVCLFICFFLCLKRFSLSRQISKTIRHRDKLSITGIKKSWV